MQLGEKTVFDKWKLKTKPENLHTLEPDLQDTNVLSFNPRQSICYSTHNTK